MYNIPALDTFVWKQMKVKPSEKDVFKSNSEYVYKKSKCTRSDGIHFADKYAPGTFFGRNIEWQLLNQSFYLLDQGALAHG